MYWKYLFRRNRQDLLSIFLAQELKNMGKKPTIIKKFYKEHQDEHELIKNNFNSLILNKKGPKQLMKQSKKTLTQ